MKKISQILKETKINKIEGDLINFDYETKKMIGKCALGVLACESGNNFLKLNINRQSVPYFDILKAYKIDDTILYPELNLDKNLGTWDFNSQQTLSGIIIRLNDTYHFTFKQIGMFLKTNFNL